MNELRQASVGMVAELRNYRERGMEYSTAFRDPITLLVLSVTWAAAATSFGMLIAAWARTTKQAEGLSTVLILLMGLAFWNDLSRLWSEVVDWLPGGM